MVLQGEFALASDPDGCPCHHSLARSSASPPLPGPGGGGPVPDRSRRERLRRSGPALRILRQALEHELVQLGWDLELRPGRRRYGTFVNVLREERQRGIRREDELPRQEPV